MIQHSIHPKYPIQKLYNIMTIKQTTPSPHCPLPPDDAERRFAFLSSRKLEVARMKRSEIRGIAFISRHFAALHTGYFTLLLKKQRDSNRGFNIFLSFIH
ncbi:hypothetical protein [Coxiella burnetii]|uniref:Uncharacterized protein n=3 Tax=Coxiella burnetii TaxID=777 RepID=B5QSD7_COXBU|nr:hypothetical protein [Coxiella burnetii]YP_002333010.1 hypothetical protein CBU_1530a [Coxiella burnetii RSA 493]ACI15301.1 hypothetical protein CBU_1530a [Coxiella burnetii RSA 493]ARI66299.1 hypothetical protein B7L74_07875 [Coxiella burnetii]MCF2093936.1 hypothetical protein [Coxiella burnetii]MCF2095969.1 hypothetical protein [Coxiella burnetii]MCF2097945.1 hypothetical protein [Coxiella burnetii]